MIRIQHFSKFTKFNSTVPFSCAYSCANASILLSRQSVICQHNTNNNNNNVLKNVRIPYRFITQSTNHFGNKSTSKSSESNVTSMNQSTAPSIGEYDTLTEYHAYDILVKLSDNDRDALKKALSKYDSDQVKSKFQGELASTKWRLRFTRRKSGEALGAVDPTGSYCAMPDDWIKKKLAAAAVRPTNPELFRIFLVNAVPFLGFGFLDNFFMIIAGDYIESSIGAYMCLSTMAAAALGNTVSDAFGLGLATYVERFCAFMGLERPNNLTPTQENMAITVWTASTGRGVGITVGCIIGMFPLLLK